MDYNMDKIENVRLGFLRNSANVVSLEEWNCFLNKTTDANENNYKKVKTTTTRIGSYLQHVFKDELLPSFFPLRVDDSFLKQKQIAFFSFSSRFLFPEQHKLLQNKKIYNLNTPGSLCKLITNPRSLTSEMATKFCCYVTLPTWRISLPRSASGTSPCG